MSDHGAVPPDLQATLTHYAQDPSVFPELLAALQRTRLLVPVIATAGGGGQVAADRSEGPTTEKDSEMATVLMRGADGRLALLAFTGVETMARWNADARPVPVATPDAARAALAEDASALAVDIAGPVPVVVEGEDLQGFAQDWTLARVGERTAWVR